MNISPDIPRIFTAFSEWCACILYIFTLNTCKRRGIFIVKAVGVLVVQVIFFTLTGELPLIFWVPCMIIAVGLMLFFIRWCSGVTMGIAAYSCVRAFVLAEMAASLEWQIHCFFFQEENDLSLMAYGLMFSVFGIVFLLMFFVERRNISINRQLSISDRELWSAILIGAVIFIISNMSFVSIRTPFSGQYGVEILSIRTMVDIGGVAILYAHHVQRCELHMRRELEAMQNVLQNQYIQYQQSKQSIDTINRKYHDLKHQISILRAEADNELRNGFLDTMEAEIKSYEIQNKTGNSVVDTVLAGKSLYCSKHGITLTSVVDGALLDFMSVMDICSIFGNALDNAIEYVEKIDDREKRLIHVAVFSQKEFILLRFENYCEEALVFQDGIPATTKPDSDYHGYGLKSIRYVAGNYDGTVTVRLENNWFELKIMFPQQEQADKKIPV
ncbi:MAG: GHKL domain-containing protein [Lachnospiraceae bacterium]|nr:GHKL domain-containing protein [Lachnospiraceae bacterium]